MRVVSEKEGRGDGDKRSPRTRCEKIHRKNQSETDANDGINKIVIESGRCLAGNIGARRQQFKVKKNSWLSRSADLHATLAPSPLPPSHRRYRKSLRARPPTRPPAIAPHRPPPSPPSPPPLFARRDDLFRRPFRGTSAPAVR